MYIPKETDVIVFRGEKYKPFSIGFCSCYIRNIENPKIQYWIPFDAFKVRFGTITIDTTKIMI